MEKSTDCGKPHKLMLSMYSTVKAIIPGAAILCLQFSAPSCEAQNVSPKATKSIDALSNSRTANTNDLSMAADYNLNNGQVDQAITACRKAIRKDPDNMEAHELYAEALERKIESLKNTDPELMRDCISEWLIVYRNEVGEEKGLGFHGISPFGHLYEDDGYAIKARQRLTAIAGRAPHPWETNARYLKSVLRHASVSGKIIHTTQQK
jgi:tetratricopeptide (TPR) repeat protein